METTVRDYGKAFEGGRRGGVAAAALPVPDASTALGGPRNVAYMDEKRVEEQDTIYALSTGSGGAVTAVAVIRISGPHVSTLVLPGLLRSSQTVKRVLRGPRFAHLCTLYEPRVVPNGAVPTNDRDSSSSSKPSSTTEEGQQHALDRAVVLYFPGPKSFTGEDVLELHLHGSRVVVSDVLEALETIGQQHHRQRGRNLGTVRMAEPGEFTQRAFASGKLDALQTEALADLLHSDTSRQRQQALKQLDGSLSKIYQNWRNELIAGLAHAEALIDFGDDEHLDDTEDDERIDDWDDNDDDKVRGMSVWGGVVDRMDALRAEMQRQLSDERRGELVREGVRIVVTGPPNAGKSTLFNLLAQRDAAIVSPHAGTTRDVLEVQLNLRGVKCRLLDTAGIRSGTCDDIERIGIDRAVTAVRSADVVVAMLDATDTEAGMQILRSIAQSEATTAESDAGVDGDSTSTPQLLPRGTPMLLVLNKSDLAESTGSSSAPHDATRSTKMHDTSDMPVGHPSHASLLARARMDQQVLGVFEISCVTQQGLDEFLSSLASTVVERVSGGGSGDEYSSSSSSSVLITRTRHRQHVTATVACLERFLAMAGHGAPVMDLAAEELRLAASELGRVTGAVDVEDVLDKLFADFCIGK
jgi:tRNA modification GTPase